MRLGIVSFWFNRGQATVMRTIRMALDELGHETFVLARPTTAGHRREEFIDTTGVWDQADVERASSFDIPADELIEWASRHRLDGVLFFQNLGFEAIGELSAAGFRTAATFMWESFSPAHGEAAGSIHDVIYSLNPASTRRYGEFGIGDVCEIAFCTAPALARVPAPARAPGGTRFMYMAGYLNARKSLGVVLDAFVAGASPDASLTVKAQTPLLPGHLIRPENVADLGPRHRNHPGSMSDLGEGDPRISIVTDDLEEHAFLEAMLGHDVIVGVSRWEGLGLHLFECEALGLPLILNDMAPFDDWVAAGGDATLVASRVLGQNKAGIDVHEPDHDSLAAAFAAASRRRPERVSDERRLERHAVRWDAFVASVEELVGRLVG